MDIEFPPDYMSTLNDLMTEKDMQTLEKLGGVSGIAKSLNINLSKGICEDELVDGCASRHSAFGFNVMPEPPKVTFFGLLFEACKDLTLIILFICACVSLGIELGQHGKNGDWYEGVAIIVAVVLVISVTAIQDYSKEKKFRKLNKKKDDRNISVLRNSSECSINIADLCVGDVFIAQTGEKLPADGIYIDGFNLAVDESTMTGETFEIKKSAEAPFMISSTMITSGAGRILITNIGPNSQWGRILKDLEVPKEQTPLQKKLDAMVTFIGKIGMGAALVVLIGRIIHVAVKVETRKNASAYVQAITLAITIIVVAVPEGLPLAVTISLAYSMKKMLADRNLVRHLAACETAGGVNVIATDKTGTLTQNRMTVVKLWAGDHFYETQDAIQPNDVIADQIIAGSSINSNCYLQHSENGQIEVIGSKTEGALLLLAKQLGSDYEAFRKSFVVSSLFSFSSDRKRMSTVVNLEQSSPESLIKNPAAFITESKYRVYVKGASEVVLGLCTHYINSEGQVAILSPALRENLLTTISIMASDALRTLCLAYRDVSESEDIENEDVVETGLICTCICGIMDPLRDDVPQAILNCHRAGIKVIMVTGDNIDTAKAIASNCHIFSKKSEDLAITGPEFRKLTDEQIIADVLPNLCVLARSQPADKARLVNLLKSTGSVVACSGDGTNDAPALKAADVGFSMGIAGTEVAKEASDIIILDDSFSSIVSAVKWGRCVYDNIRKFLQFQLTINCVALVISMVFALGWDDKEPLTALQLLWVNLIMDTLAALALATESPTDSLLDRPPHGRDDFLVSPNMWKFIAGHAVYQSFLIFVTMFLSEKALSYHEINSSQPIATTIVFNTFIFCNIFNMFNARKVYNERNVFSNIFSSPLFSIVWLIIVAVQLVIMCVPALMKPFSLVKFVPASEEWKCWVWSLIFGLGTFALQQVLDFWNLDVYFHKKKNTETKKDIPIVVDSFTS